MRKRAVLATPSLAVGLALRSFAASVAKDEERRKKRLKTSSAAAAAAEAEAEAEAERDGRLESGAEGSSNRAEKRPPHTATWKASTWDSEAEAENSLNWAGVGESDEAAAEGLQDWSLPSDTLVALKMMCQQFPKLEQIPVRPFVLRSQLYSSVSDRTTADRELEELKQQRSVRIFKLNSGKDDFGIMFQEDYLQQIDEEKKRMSKKRPEEDARVFDWFATHVVTAQTGVSIGHSYLISLLSLGGKVNDKQVSLLINSGLLVRQIADETTYWFGIPNVGTLLKSLAAGRKELQLFLSRRRYKEMIQALLEKRRLRSSQLDMRFHVRDLIGSGHLYSIQTPAGPLIRLARD